MVKSRAASRNRRQIFRKLYNDIQHSKTNSNKDLHFIRVLTDREFASIQEFCTVLSHPIFEKTTSYRNVFWKKQEVGTKVTTTCNFLVSKIKWFPLDECCGIGNVSYFKVKKTIAVNPESYFLLGGIIMCPDLLNVPPIHSSVMLDCTSRLRQNITKSSHHHGTEGIVHGFGCHGLYGFSEKDTKSSIGDYAPPKSRKKIVQQTEIRKKIVQETEITVRGHLVKTLELLEETIQGTTGISHLFQSVNIYSKVMKKAANKADLTNWTNKVLLDPITGYQVGFCNYNARTRVPHCEPDGSYTVIVTPQQTNINKEANTHCFEWFLTQTEPSLKIPMKPGLALFYSAKFVTHKQTQLRDTTLTVPFLNFSYYNNKKLFDHGSKSIKRNLKEKKYRNNSLNTV